MLNNDNREKEVILEDLVKKIRDSFTFYKGELTDQQAMAMIEANVLKDKHLSMCSHSEKYTIIRQLFYRTRKDLDILQPYLEDDQVSEIMVNGKEHIFIEKNGQVRLSEMKFDTTERLEEVIRRIAAKVHREINELNPIVDARLEDGSRVNAVYKNVALNGPILTIRKFPQSAIDMETLIAKDSITQEAADFLKSLVRAGYNCFISGGTSSGKTTFLNVLSNYIPPEERVIVIEDSAELQIRQIRNLVRLECRQANVQGKGGVQMDALVRTSLRMRPDRIIVGEVRGSEILDLIQALNTGHSGSMSTGHGNSIGGMLKRMESMFLQAADFPVEAIRSQIAEGLDIMIHLGRLSDGSRKVLEIAELKGIFDGTIALNPLFGYRRAVGLTRTKNPLIHTEKLDLKGETIL